MIRGQRKRRRDSNESDGGINGGTNGSGLGTSDGRAWDQVHQILRDRLPRGQVLAKFKNLIAGEIVCLLEGKMKIFV